LSKSVQISTANASSNDIKIGKFGEDRARDTPMRGVYIPKLGKMSVKFSVLGGFYTLIVPPMGMKISPHRCNVSPLRGEKPQNRRLSNLYTVPALCTPRNAAGDYFDHLLSLATPI